VKERRAAFDAEYPGTQEAGTIPSPAVIGTMKEGRPASCERRGISLLLRWLSNSGGNEPKVSKSGVRDR